MFWAVMDFVNLFYLFPKLISGEHIGALAMSEPNCKYLSVGVLFSMISAKGLIL
jgi:hypothetical protein